MVHTHVPVPWMVRFLPLISWLMNLGMSFSGYWWGPYTLFPLVMMTGRLNDLGNRYTQGTQKAAGRGGLRLILLLMHR